MMRSPLRILTLASTLAVAAVPAAAQVVTVGEARGWIGASFEMVTTEQGGSRRTVVTVTDVIQGGPAAQAGVRPGDVVITVNGLASENQFGGIAVKLRAGDPVRMVVERDGRRRELQITAAPRPVDMVVTPQSWSVTFHADSMVDRMYRAMDSLRIRLIRGEDGSLAVVSGAMGPDSLSAVIHRMPDGIARVRSTSTARVAEVAPAAGIMVPEVRPPFSFFIFRGEKHDSLRTEMDRLNDDIRELRSQQAARVQELARQARGGRIDRNDAELVRLDEALRKVDAEASELRMAMDEASRREAGERWGTRWLEAPPTSAAPPIPVEDLTRARPLAPYVLGQNRAAGAEVVDLRPELADYFNVSGGVLIVDVPEGTPAALAGLQPGDVVINVDGRDVLSITDLREGLARAAPQIPLTLVRKGRQVQVLLRR